MVYLALWLTPIAVLISCVSTEDCSALNDTISEDEIQRSVHTIQLLRCLYEQLVASSKQLELLQQPYNYFLIFISIVCGVASGVVGVAAVKYCVVLFHRNRIRGSRSEDDHCIAPLVGDSGEVRGP